MTRTKNSSVDRRPRTDSPTRAGSSHRTSSSVVAEVVETSGQVADQSEQDVHRRGLHVPARLPARDSIRAKAQQPGQAGLRQVESVANRSDLIGREELVLLAIDRDRVLTKPLRVLESQHNLAAVWATQVSGRPDGNFF